MLKFQNYMQWQMIQPRIERMTRQMFELNLNPVWVFHSVFIEGRDAEDLFNEIAPLVPQVGQQPVSPNPQQLQQMGTFVNQFMRQKTGNAGFDQAINSLDQQLKLMQQNKKVPQAQGQQVQPQQPNANASVQN